ncbi:MAG: acyl carrier protein [Proteobacteria bacterium]|nr:acyl carrier protein [Pseudomonadota bacterium]
MQPHESTLALVQRVLAAEFNLKQEDLDPARGLDELGVDSLAVIEALFRLENELQIHMPGEPGSVRTVRDIVDLVDRLLAERDIGKKSEAKPSHA